MRTYLDASSLSLPNLCLFPSTRVSPISPLILPFSQGSSVRVGRRVIWDNLESRDFIDF